MDKQRNYVTPYCPICKVRKCYRKDWRKDGSPMFFNKCSYCRKILYPSQSGTVRPVKVKMHEEMSKLTCSKCSFKAEHAVQLDIDHIDGNRENNDISNLQVLCANCHRLKTFINKDFERPPYNEPSSEGR